MILGHNVGCRDTMSRLPILVLDCSKGSHLESGTCQRDLNFGFFRGQKFVKLPEIFMGQSCPTDPPFPGGFIPWAPAPCTSTKKNRVQGERLLGSVKLRKENNRVTLRFIHVSKCHQVRADFQLSRG